MVDAPLQLRSHLILRCPIPIFWTRKTFRTRSTLWKPPSKFYRPLAPAKIARWLCRPQEATWWRWPTARAAPAVELLLLNV
jgi:hypothetical protein